MNFSMNLNLEKIGHDMDVGNVATHVIVRELNGDSALLNHNLNDCEEERKEHNFNLFFCKRRKAGVERCR